MEIRWHSARKAARALVAAGLAVGVLAVPARAQVQSQVTFTKDIVPILQRSCQNCHNPFGVAPMSLTTYEEVRPWARAIQRATSAREMPPWYIEKTVGIQHFKDDPSLSVTEIAKIASWVSAGSPQGNPADMPPLRRFEPQTSWAIGTPDLIVRTPIQTIRAVGSDRILPYLGSAPTGLTETRYIQAYEAREVRPFEGQLGGGRSGVGNNYFTFHHQTMTSRPPDNGDLAGAGGIAPGSLDEFLWTYEVGHNAQYYPEDVGVPLKPGAVIYFTSTHQHSIGKEVQAQLEVAFKFYPRGYVPKYAGGGRAVGARTGGGGLGADLDIPGNTDNIRRDEMFVLNKPARMITFEPHLHAAGKRMCVEATYPDGRTETLSCAGYNHAWVRSYVYQDDYAPLLPKGTIIRNISWYDNTANNPRVIDPRNWRGTGLRSLEEMFLNIGQFLYYTDEEFEAEVAARKAKMMRLALQNTTASR